MSKNLADSTNRAHPERSNFKKIVSGDEMRANVLELLPPGSFAKLDNQPNDLPPFQVIHCRGGRCWVRQQSWGRYVKWEVSHRRLKQA